jgi:hypothetical protein
MTQPEDLADRIIDFIEDQGGRVEIWHSNLIRQWWGGPRRCIKCRKPIDHDGNLCVICKFEPTTL